MRRSADNPLHLSPADAALAALLLARAVSAGDAAALEAHVAAAPALAGHAGRLSLLAPLIAETADAPDGFDTVLELIAAPLDADSGQTAYALTADYVAACSPAVSPEEMRFLERLGEALQLDRLTRAALDMAARTRNAGLEGEA